MGQGFFISFEGIDGCGKTTAAALLDEHLRGLGYQTLITREPGGSPLGHKLRQLLLLEKGLSIDAREEALLFAADRAAHVREFISPALKAGKIVLCDRYTDSTLAYQGGGAGLDQDFLRQLNHFAGFGLSPDLSFYFQVPLGVARARMAQRKSADDNMEQSDNDFFGRVDRLYQSLALAEPERIRRIDGNQPIDAVFQEMLACLPARLQRGAEHDGAI